MKNYKIYVSGPISRGDMVNNIRQAIDASNILVSHGFIPFVPHLSHFWNLMNPLPYETWIKMDLEWIKVCDAILRLPGLSNGGDIEVGFSESHGMPIFYDVQSLIDYFSKLRQKNAMSQKFKKEL